eukprot:7587107-Alexandrium_andersonii.AAC.1
MHKELEHNTSEPERKALLRSEPIRWPDHRKFAHAPREAPDSPQLDNKHDTPCTEMSVLHHGF